MGGIVGRGGGLGNSAVAHTRRTADTVDEDQMGLAA